MDHEKYVTWKISRLFYLLSIKKICLGLFYRFIIDNIIFQDYEESYVRDILLSSRNILQSRALYYNKSVWISEGIKQLNRRVLRNQILSIPIVRFFCDIRDRAEVFKSIPSFRRSSGRTQDFSKRRSRAFLANVQNEGLSLQFSKREHVVNPTWRAIYVHILRGEYV